MKLNLSQKVFMLLNFEILQANVAPYFGILLPNKGKHHRN